MWRTNFWRGLMKCTWHWSINVMPKSGYWHINTLWWGWINYNIIPKALLAISIQLEAKVAWISYGRGKEPFWYAEEIKSAVNTICHFLWRLSNDCQINNDLEQTFTADDQWTGNEEFCPIKQKTKQKFDSLNSWRLDSDRILTIILSELWRELTLNCINV